MFLSKLLITTQAEVLKYLHALLISQKPLIELIISLKNKNELNWTVQLLTKMGRGVHEKPGCVAYSLV